MFEHQSSLEHLLTGVQGCLKVSEHLNSSDHPMVWV
jgi:hypothetical protein